MWDSVAVTVVNILVGLAIVVGLAGIIIPILPGVLLIAGALLGWALVESSATGWTVFGIALVVLVIGQVVKYLIPGRQLKAAVPTKTLVFGALGAVVGFFVIPFIGVFVGFPLGVYAAELARVGSAAAGTSTRHALKAMGLGIVIELASAVLASAAWVTGLILVAG